MNKYRLTNNIAGWLTFVIATTVYLMTIESTASFWDCGEFISSAYKLEVGHPPGAPFFTMMGRLFSLLAGSDKTLVPIMINCMSALASGFTILFLFWSITHLAKKIIIKDENGYTIGNMIAIIGSGLIGALVYTFSDSFWFSAVEGEVYGTSSFFTAIVFWAILKWENEADEKYANRWIIFIAYMMGLSIGVHLLNLLAIPAMVFVYYFKKYKVSRKGLILTSLISIVLLGAVMYGVIQGVVIIASWFELLFVNGLGLPFNSGVFFYFIVLIGVIIYGLYYSYKHKKVILNTIILSVTVLLVGYSSVAMIVIRSLAEPPMDQNDPDNLFSLLAYLNREQYGDRPLMYGQFYNKEAITGYDEGKPIYTPQNGKYEVTSHKPEYKFDSRFTTIFPRMFSSEQDHVKAYKEWADIKGRTIKVTNNNNETVPVTVPTFMENLKFFWKYQVGFMYFRYFMWNFSGRQNDIQGTGEVMHGNWISGIKFIDEARLGSQDKLPDNLAKNKGRNKYYMLPLILGLIGLWYHYSKNKRDFTVVALFFFFTGLAIVLYLNQTPYQPRERDYAYAGSFYAFAIWIGLGVLALYDSLKNKVNPAAVGAGVTLLCLGVPYIMAKENWNDHNRTGRTTARDFAYNYLNSCAPNAIIFTNGDNDTFPLWYAQEVEGIRTDVRVANLSYLGADWYIRQMQRKAYESDPVPIKFTEEQYLQGKRDVVYLTDQIKDKYTDLKEALEFVASEDPRTKQLNNYPDRIDFIPTKKFSLKVDANAVLSSGTVPESMKDQIVPEMRWEINRNYITKSDLMVLDILAQNNWKRPIYFAITVSRENYQSLESYFQVDGLAYKIIPVKNNITGDIGSINTEVMYDNMINKFRWGGIDNPKVYLDENNLRMLSNFRNNFSRLAESLLAAGKKDSALKVLEKCMKLMPNEQVPYNYFVLPIAEIYYKLNEIDKANAIINQMANIFEKSLNYYLKLPARFSNGIEKDKVDYEKRVCYYILNNLVDITKNFGQKELNESLSKRFEPIFANASVQVK